ncbi:hypothetical protein L6164_015534 [Bauhinia variegata]|uniref:Uncharacterized protein n=1 Tax=Bauhinia variegata TaxID=167791 RepID=A0ACB9NKW8_BAUVA|nr:hypothetical protein L6164_015534 [Bauhinia variegata]
MASPTVTVSDKPQKRLAEFLKEQQEPFILEVYLLERGYSKKWSLIPDRDNSGQNLERSASCGLIKKRKTLQQFSKVLTAVYKKLAFQKESRTSSEAERRNEDETVPETGRVSQIVLETERFSSASSSTVFNSCSEIEEEETWIPTHDDNHSHDAKVPSVQATNSGKDHRRYIEDGPASFSHSKMPSRRISISQKDETLDGDVRRSEQRICSCGVLLPRKMTEESLLSASLWGLLVHSAKKEGSSVELREMLGPNFSQVLKSKRVLQQTKQLLFDCVRQITLSIPRKDKGHQGYKQFLGPEELGRLICAKTKEWGKQASDQTNLTNLLTLDYLNSIDEWCDFQPHKNDISVEIADAIFERVSDETVSEIIEILAPTV